MNLDNLKQIKSLDKEFVAESISALPDQINQVLKQAEQIKIPTKYKNITHVVINGMGGSNLGGRMIKSVMSEYLKLPLLIEPGYEVPNFVGKNTLYIISSYSGNTEEPLSTYREVQKREAKIMAITEDGSGNKLKKLMNENNIPGLAFNPEFNPSKQPRLGVGYTVFGTIIMLAKTGLFKLDEKETKKVIAMLTEKDKKLVPEIKTSQNQAKKYALALHNKQIIFVGSEFLIGNTHIIRNQTNECSKNFASYLTIPELNHYSMEGLSYPASNSKNLIFMFFESNLYRPRIQKRNKLTKEVVKKNGVKILSHKLTGKTKFEQAFEMLQLGAWITYYLGMLNGVDPVKIPWVDWFKKQLK